MMDQFIVGSAGWTALRVSLMKPEPDDSSVILLTEAADQSFVIDAGHNMRVFSGAGVLLGP